VLGAGAITETDVSDGEPPRVAFTNLIACIPIDAEEGDKVSEPPFDSVLACSPRLIEFVEIARPQLIVTVGKQAKEWLEPGMRDSIRLSRDVPRLDIVHPAFILRAKDAQKNHLIRRVVIQLRNAVESL
jgi:uracil-DNA glycosylase